MAVSGVGKPASVARKITMISATFDESRKNTNLRILE
jgi:hypothetical protein